MYPKIHTDVPGPRSVELFERLLEHAGPGMSLAASLSRIAIQRADGFTVEDVDGNVYLDFCSGTVVANTGHSHPRVVEAIQELAPELLHSYDFNTTHRVEFFERLASTLPPHLDAFYMYSSGAESVDAAVRLARAATRRSEIIALRHANHGKTSLTLAMQGTNRKAGFSDHVGNVHFTLSPYCFRCPIGLEFPTCGARCASAIDDVVSFEASGEIAAVVIEPIQGGNGVIPLPPAFAQQIQDFCRRTGALLVVDEILAGAGRAGALWMFPELGLEPDIVTLGKGLSSGIPMAVMAVRREIAEREPWSLPTQASTTFGGNPLAAAVASANLQILLDEKLSENAMAVGSVLLDRLRAMKASHPVIGDVRGRGLLIGVELVGDPGTRAPVSHDVACELFMEMLRRGLFTSSPGSVIRIVPPLTITEEAALVGMDILEEAISAVERRGLVPQS